MTYSIKEIFYTLQGEGFHAGRPAVFCRFAGCNLWSGLERDRENAVCKFCDTDFVGTNGTNGGKFKSASVLAEAILSQWPSTDNKHKFVVLTGGEPLLQLDEKLIDELKARGFYIAVETNGTIEAPNGIDWLCVSPKAGAQLKQFSANELKLVFPQSDAYPELYESYKANYHYLQPMDGADSTINTESAIQYCLSYPKWKLSIQTHKIIGIR